MDINIALTRAGIFVFVYALVLGIPFGLAGWGREWLMNIWGQNWFWAPMVLLLGLATAGPFIYQYLNKQAEELILKEQKQYQKVLRDSSVNMLLIKELGRLLKTIASNIVDTVRVSWVGIYLQDEKSGKYVLRYKQARAGEVKLPEEFLGESELARHLSSSRLPIAGEEAAASHLKIGLAAPCSVDEVMLGFILLGDKPRNTAYTQDDVNVFTILANQTALAIENCQFYHQQKQYQHSLRTASLDRQMASMVHEIDNPIQGICGSVESLGMILDEVEKHIPEEKLKYARTKLERVLFNAMRISNMIGVVRDYSKPTTGELILETLQDILEAVHLIMQPQFKHSNIDYLQDIPKEIVWLRANKVELEQVLVNLATNSVQAIDEVWAVGANTPETKCRITLKAYKIDGNILRIDFSDTGSGIKREILEDIFLDFVTTKASSVGTGLGLSISRKIIQRHKGKMWAESEGENKGAAFHWN